MSRLIHAFGYIKARLGEGSTWTLFAAAAAGANVLSKPWNYIAMACGIIAAMVPNRGHNHDVE